VTNINCTADCIYQKEGKCILSNLSQMNKINGLIDDYIDKNKVSDENSNINCAYYIKAKK